MSEKDMFYTINKTKNFPFIILLIITLLKGYNMTITNMEYDYGDTNGDTYFYSCDIDFSSSENIFCGGASTSSTYGGSLTDPNPILASFSNSGVVNYVATISPTSVISSEL
jgi:hypothetical protein